MSKKKKRKNHPMFEKQRMAIEGELTTRFYESLSQVSELQKLNELEKTKWQEGVWSYMCDHATASPKGFTVRFFVRNRDDFWQRVSARKTGQYQRVDVKKMADEVERMIYGVSVQAYRDKRLNDLKNNGRFYIRWFLAIRKFINDTAIKLTKKGQEWQDFKKKPFQNNV